VREPGQDWKVATVVYRPVMRARRRFVAFVAVEFEIDSSFRSTGLTDALTTAYECGQGFCEGT
jgi:hypothetical protein